MIDTFLPDIQDAILKDDRKTYLDTLLVVLDFLEDLDDQKTKGAVEWLYVNEKWPAFKIIPYVPKLYRQKNGYSIPRKKKYIKRDKKNDIVKFYWNQYGYYNNTIPTKVHECLLTNYYNHLWAAYSDLFGALYQSGEL